MGRPRIVGKADDRTARASDWKSLRLPAGLKRHPRPLLMAAALSMVAGLGWIDLYVDRELSFQVLYLGPVLLAGWYLGQWAALGVSLASATVWVVDEIIAAYDYAHPAIPYWNLGAKFFIFVLFGYLITWLRRSQERQQRAERERIEAELRIAKEVQSLLFPQSIPEFPTLDCSCICIPAREVSGDYYDCIPLDDGRLVLAVADVSGEGVPAALLMARLQALLRTHVHKHRDSPARLVSEINRGMFLGDGTGKYATFVCALYDETQRRLTCVNAGHNIPLLIRADSGKRAGESVPGGAGSPEILRLDRGGFPLGLFRDSAYEQQTVALAPGDVLVFYTDGLVETIGRNGEEFGVNRLAGIVFRRNTLSALELQEAILDEGHRFRAEADSADDVTLMLVRVK